MAEWVGKRFKPWPPVECEAHEAHTEDPEVPPSVYAVTGVNGYTWGLCARCTAFWRDGDVVVQAEAIRG